MRNVSGFHRCGTAHELHVIPFIISLIVNAYYDTQYIALCIVYFRLHLGVGLVLE